MNRAATLQRGRSERTVKATKYCPDVSKIASLLIELAANGNASRLLAKAHWVLDDPERTRPIVAHARAILDAIDRELAGPDTELAPNRAAKAACDDSIALEVGAATTAVADLLSRIVRSRGDLHASGVAALVALQRLEVRDDVPAARELLIGIAREERRAALAATAVAELAEEAIAALEATHA